MGNSSHSPSSFQIPWLMLAEDEGGSEIRGFCSLSEGGIVQRVELPEAKGKHCIGSLDWLITVDDNGYSELLHPITRVRIPLPYYKEVDVEMEPKNQLIRRAALSASPSVNKYYILMVILGRSCLAAFWKPGDKTWTLVQPCQPVVCLDVIYYKDQFFAINKGFKKLILGGDSNSGGDAAVEIVYAKDFGMDNAYLVESPGGDLLVVSRERDFGDDGSESYYTRSFSIYKLVSTYMNKWERIYDLQGAAIFVGHSAAKAVVASAGIKPNCVYFTDDYADGYSSKENVNVIGGRDTGIYDLETQTVEPLPGVGTPLSNYCPPIWVFPSF